MPELKPCPFCGGEASIAFRFNTALVTCNMCGANAKEIGSSFGVGEKEIAKAIEAWNRRAEGTRPTNLAGKCGSCAHAKPYSCGGSKSYVECTNPTHLAKIKGRGELARVRQRTCKACQQYKRREDA